MEKTVIITEYGKMLLLILKKIYSYLWYLPFKGCRYRPVGSWCLQQTPGLNEIEPRYSGKGNPDYAVTLSQ